MSNYRLIKYQLTRPIAYLFIKHRDKYIYDWLIPALLLMASSTAYYFLNFNILNLFVFSEKLSSFIATLPGFFIAALAAIATFNRVDIDRPMSGEESPTIETLINAQYLDVELSRRRFLCMLFSFLTVESIFIAIFGMFSSSFEFFDADKVLIPSGFALFYLAIYFFMAFQLLTATMHGMYYLGDRIHYQ